MTEKKLVLQHAFLLLKIVQKRVMTSNSK